MYWVDAWRSEILAVDPWSGDIRVLDLGWKSGLEQELTSVLLQKRDDGLQVSDRVQGPAAIWRAQHDTGFLLEYKVPLTIVSVDQNLQRYPAKAGTDLMLFDSPDSSPGTTESQKIRSLSWLHGSYQTQPVGDHGWMSFASVRRISEADSSSWAYRETFIFVKGSDWQVLGDGIPALVDPSKELLQNYHLVYLPYMAEVHGNGFALLLEQEPRLLRFRPGDELELLPEFPEDFGYRPHLLGPDSRQTTWQQDELSFYRTLERSDLAAAIFSIENRLFLLAKKMETPDRAAWWMVQLNPDTGGEIGRFRIPVRSDAFHLTVIPGPEVTTFVEKEAAQGTRDSLPFLQVRSMVHVPTSWLTGPLDGVLAPETQAQCW